MRNSFSFGHVLALSVAIRVSLILYSDWHDAHSAVKYTDVDYRVFTDAAKFLASSTTSIARGPWGSYTRLGELVSTILYALWECVQISFSPYERETYRYTPLLALVLTPNQWFHPSFGKYLFAACDIVNGIVIHSILRNHVLPFRRDITNPTQTATLYSCLYLLNPLVFSISTRGSSESVLSLFVLATLYYALAGKWKGSAIMLGLSAHWKIYPIIYGVGTLSVVGRQHIKNSASRWRAMTSRQAIGFTLLSSLTFLLLGALCYAM
jgi:phosphatidylinositol glycan class M